MRDGGLHCELVFNKKGNKTKNIYWNNRKGTAKKYLDGQYCDNNGHTLGVPNDKFDFRNQ
ncbi:hypothetical protein ABD90_22555 [Lysinibacillus fusiformis]|uniref:Uncharacterized protein n=1 Tax=Lysinibacillus sphaericus CBAM5 TaxID=1400869 RepID=W7RWT9_LYSSH|nr:hypothetical protein P799_01270 [Lysinibacillus sphaericus CBAM5]MBG9710198.1 hypothetical protein [Lysinibacillus sphaericus]MBG9727955.1 hypothetical protein [Lysinibacillus fusiformis]MBG9731184.1 hypothetical protein [Lysinibacillus sphaericus]MBG9740436.1 hypothetical protein [Lysinibacillus sphaericus]